MTLHDEKEEVRRVLREAFSDWRNNPDNPPLAHNQCLDMRTKLLSIRTEDIDYFLPQILEDLLDTHTNKPDNSEDVESVIDFLDVPTVSSDGAVLKERLGREGLEGVRNQEEELRSEKYSALAHITPVQAKALCAWFKYARTWDDLEWNIDLVDSAYAYWNGRAQAN